MRKFWFAVALGLALSLVDSAGATPRTRESEPREYSGDPLMPEQYFQQALEDYRNGRYRAAIEALRVALALDPKGKDLVYNLAILHEKLGELDLAIAALSRYIELEADPKEITRAEQAIARMRGAQAELRSPTPVAVPLHLPERGPRQLPLRRSRGPAVDEWVLVGSGVAAAAALVGVVFGVRALAFRSGSARTPEARRARADRVQSAALVADVGISVGLVAGASTALLWLTRTPPSSPYATVSDGGRGLGVSVQGAF